MPRRDDDDEERDGTVTQPMRRTGAHRVLTPTDIRQLTEAQARADADMADERSRDARTRDLELLAAEWFGRAGSGGKLAAMDSKLVSHEARLDNHEGTIATLTEFKGRLLLLGGLAVTVGGGLAALAFKVIDHVLK